MFLVRHSGSLYHFQFGVQSRIFILAFDETIFLYFGVQSHIFNLALRVAFSFRHQSSCSFSVWRSKPLFIFRLVFKATFSFRHPDPYFLFGVQSHIFILAFRAIPSVRRSRPHCHLGVHSRIFSLAFRAVVCLQFDIQSHFPFGVQSRCSSSVWRSEPLFHFDIQSHCIFSLVFRAAFSFWYLEPLFVSSLAFRTIMYFFCSAFRAISSVWCSEPHFQFDVQIRCLLGVQSHIFSLTLRVLTSFFSFDVQIHLYFPSFLAFSAIRRTPSGLLSHIFTFHFGVQSHFSYSFRHSMPPSLFSLAF